MDSCINHYIELFTECHLLFCCLCSRQKIELPLMENVQTIPPPYVVRTVLIYSRHAGQLQLNPSEAFSVRRRTAKISLFHCKLDFLVCFWLVSAVHRLLIEVKSLACSCVLPQKMLQSPYFFFDVVYLHNGVEEQGDETSWRVSETAFLGVIYHLYISVQEKNFNYALGCHTYLYFSFLRDLPNLLHYIINTFGIPCDP